MKTIAQGFGRASLTFIFTVLSILVTASVGAAEELPVEKLFFSYTTPGMSAPVPIREYRLLPHADEAFLAKVELLLGYKPAPELISNKDPYVDLDFSHLPKFERIFVSTLLFRQDFSGTILARLLEQHAHRGTEVYVISTGYMDGKNDQNMLREIARREPHFHVANFKYDLTKDASLFKNIESKLNPVRDFKNLLKDLHVKLLVTESKHPEGNVVITGGRNVHDGFLFSEKPMFPSHTELDQLKPKESYVYWQDFDIEMVSPELVQVAIHHIETLITMARSQNSKFVEMVQTAAEINSKSSEENGIWARQVLSMPYADGRALEKLYVDLIDAARTSIVISSPYLMPMPEIKKALERAIARRVPVQIETRINLEGDTQAWLYEATNIDAINSLYEKAKIFEWTKPSILHTKMMIIDRRVAVVGSVNLSHRSFVEDIEGVTLLHGSAVIEQLVQLQTEYHNQSRPITTKQKVKLLGDLVVHMIPDEF